MNIKRKLRFSIASVLMVMVIVALVGRTSMDRVRMALLSQELALHDSVEHQRALVAQRRLDVETLKSQVPPGTNMQLLNWWAKPTSSNGEEQVSHLLIHPASIELRRELARIRNAELRLVRDQAKLVEREKELRLRVEDRVPKT